MKRNILYLAVCGILLSSCADILDVSPDGQKSLDDIFSNEQTTGGYFNKCYKIPTFGYTDESQDNLPTAISDDAWIGGKASGYTNNVYRGEVTPEGNNNKLACRKGILGIQALTLWEHYYTYIRRLNTFLSRIDNAAVPSEEERARWKAEARVLRAFYYMELINNYSKAYIITEPVEVGFDESKLRISDYKTVADFIIKECREAMKEPQLPWRSELGTDSKRMTKGIAAAIKSRVALFMASPLFANGENRWEEAKAICKESLDELLSHDYALYTEVRNPEIYGDNAYHEFSTSTQDFSTSPVDKESILVTSAKGDQWNYHGLPINKAKFAGMCPTQELVDAYPMKDGKYVLDLAKPYNDEKHLEPNYNVGSGYDPENPYENRDPRFYASIYYNGSTALNSNNQETVLEMFRTGNCAIELGDPKRTYTGYYARRHYHPLARQGRAMGVSFRYMRLAEIYLNYAECCIETNDLTNALAAIKPIRDRVKMPNLDDPAVGIPVTQDNLRLMYRNERRVEMAYEETRYHDLRRWSQPGLEDDMEEVRYQTGMWIEKDPDTGKLTYMRFCIGDKYDHETKTWAGTRLEKKCYTAKYKLVPHDNLEASRMLQKTGENIQNPGW